MILKRGHSLAPIYKTYDFNDFLIGTSNYQNPIETGVWHSHEKPVISLVLYGTNTEYRKGKEIERTSGSINYYNSYELHRNIYTTFPSKHINLEIDDTFLKKYGFTEESIELAVAKNYYARFTFIKLMNEAEINDLQSYNAIEMLFVAFIENSLNSKDEILFPKWMLSVRDLLNDRWDENISLKEIANKVNVHPTTISKNFRTYFQCTLGEYSRKLKIDRSLDLLKSKQYSLTEIAYICGFSDQSHFTRVFKSISGYLPKEYVKV
ncbi:helix-turn-helix transcriptional regulator [Aquimarina megaterium]|uniref:helix-turn-helix transcriptional regulator n=1 Tax=Aquimarina megaterium TaxID=1443666 RepID=UPI0004715D30|nr:AraC family transcriptional regulator [Aquimarina megaterium]